MKPSRSPSVVSVSVSGQASPQPKTAVSPRRSALAKTVSSETDSAVEEEEARDPGTPVKVRPASVSSVSHGIVFYFIYNTKDYIE